MTEQTTPLEKLQLNGRYYRCLIRHGYTTIEQIENYLSDKNAEPLSKNIANMSPRGDYEVADSIHYYRTGQHLPRPSGIDAMTIKKDDEIRLIKMYRELSHRATRGLKSHTKSRIKVKLQVIPCSFLMLPIPTQLP